MSAMTNRLVPGWIKKIKGQQDSDAATAKFEAKQTALLSETIEADGPAFWAQLLKQIEITLGSLDIIGLCAQTTPIGGSEEGHQIIILGGSSLRGQVFTNLFYGGPGTRFIGCHPNDAPPYNLEFCLGVLGLMVLENGGSPMSAEEAAQHIIEPMVKRLMGQEF